MMRSADALCGVYPELNRDLLLTGVLFHDCGKLWENCYPEHGFNQILSLHGEMMGHIPLGIELANKLWRDMAESPEAAASQALSPADEDVRLHLLHLIGSHHGEHQFGSPVLPRTPEAFALHYIDNAPDLRTRLPAAHQPRQTPARFHPRRRAGGSRGKLTHQTRQIIHAPASIMCAFRLSHEGMTHSANSR